MANARVSIQPAVARRRDRVVADGYAREIAALRRVVRFGVLRGYARQTRPVGWLARWRWSRRIERDVNQAMARLEDMPSRDALFGRREVAARQDRRELD